MAASAMWAAQVSDPGGAAHAGAAADRMAGAMTGQVRHLEHDRGHPSAVSPHGKGNAASGSARDPPRQNMTHEPLEDLRRVTV